MRGAGVGNMQPVGLGDAPKGYTGRKTADMRADHRAWLDAQPLVTRCAFCDWTHAGTAGDGRAAALAHRRVAHPTAGKKRRPKTPGIVGMSPRPAATAASEEARAAAMVEVRRRQARAGGGRLCRRGCGQPAVTGLRGRFANLCHEHDLEERRVWRDQISGRAAA